MVELIKSATFDRWLRDLRDKRAAARILARLDRLAVGNPGDVKPVGEGISEMRIDYGPGYRVYFLQRGLLLIVLLCGGGRQVYAGPGHRPRQGARCPVEGLNHDQGNF